MLECVFDRKGAYRLVTSRVRLRASLRTGVVGELPREIIDAVDQIVYIQKLIIPTAGIWGPKGVAAGVVWIARANREGRAHTSADSGRGNVGWTVRCATRGNVLENRGLVHAGSDLHRRHNSYAGLVCRKTVAEVKRRGA